ncbi:hypothetical protein SPF06_19645 [Sinomonas sp. JGH33]|uniref:Centromere protein J C-terminal domain-containing protein n=1 Tax=Sinomonas terricola TaxID=3110330 RepID=A0ABU5TBN4_9MICC|nr:hypothetical protein [Sinomonas sp. JGH33]MEA5456942.1 hypothetical protein [Sinomonas sp. JGH33]
MGNIPIKARGSETRIEWKDGKKIVYTDNGTRVDIYQNGAGRPDGEGHDHLFATFNKKGEATNTGGYVS